MKFLVLTLAFVSFSASALVGSAPTYYCGKKTKDPFTLTLKADKTIALSSAGPEAVGWEGGLQEDLAAVVVKKGFVGYNGQVVARCAPTVACPKFLRNVKALIQQNILDGKMSGKIILDGKTESCNLLLTMQ